MTGSVINGAIGGRYLQQEEEVLDVLGTINMKVSERPGRLQHSRWRPLF